MEQNNNQDLRLLLALNELYTETKTSKKLILMDFFVKNKIKYAQFVIKVIIDNKIVLNEREGHSRIITWNTIKPNIQMCNKINNEALILSKKQNEKTSERRKGINPKDNNLPSEVKNTLDFLNEVYDKCNKTHEAIDKKNLAKKFNVKNKSHAPESLNKIGFISIKGRKSIWVGSKPNKEMAIHFNEFNTKTALFYINRQREDRITSKSADILKEKEKERYEQVADKLSIIRRFDNPEDIIAYEKSRLPFNYKQKQKEFENINEEINTDKKQYKKVIKIFGITIYTKTITKLP